jgi:hypothetical protein
MMISAIRGSEMAGHRTWKRQQARIDAESVQRELALHRMPQYDGTIPMAWISLKELIEYVEAFKVPSDIPIVGIRQITVPTQIELTHAETDGRTYVIADKRTLVALIPLSPVTFQQLAELESTN